MNRVLALGKKVEGHSAGAKNQKLAAYVGTGASSCHEPIDLAQTLKRLRMGVYVMAWEGGARKDLKAISKITDTDVDLRRMILVTDSVTPVIGADEADMVLAENRIGQLQGGSLFTSRGRILAELPMPIIGLMPDLPVEEIAEKMKLVNQAARAAGCVFDDPVLSLVTMTSAAIPHLRICEQGLFNLKPGKILDHLKEKNP